MQRGSMTDREAYPTAWITLAVLVLLYLLWRFALGAPTVSRCWVWEHWHLYCRAAEGALGADGPSPGTGRRGSLVPHAGG